MKRQLAVISSATLTGVLLASSSLWCVSGLLLIAKGSLSWQSFFAVALIFQVAFRLALSLSENLLRKVS